MLGTKGVLTQVTSFYKERTEELKKVDIDIFKSGRTKNLQYTYQLKTLISSNVIQISLLNKKMLKTIFKINIKEGKEIASTIVDSEIKLNTVKSGDIYETSTTLTSSGRHEVKVTLKSGESYTVPFYISQIENEAGSKIDIPIDSYKEALMNVVKLWMLSNRYDRVRQPNWAGFFDSHLRSYLMNEEGAAQLEKDLADAIRNKLSDVVLQNVKAKPLLNERGWDIKVDALDTRTQISTNASNSESTNHFLISDNEGTPKVEVINDD